MKINDFNLIQDKETFLPVDENGRIINIYHLDDSVIVGKSLVYPNLLLYSIKDKQLYTPLKERAMSLKNEDIVSEYDQIFSSSYSTIEDTPVFFFVYNTDNYYHFIYDTLPILLSFFYLKKRISNLKLLMNYPNAVKHDFYTFVKEFLQIAGIDVDKDIILTREDVLYRDVYISNSFTHDIDSNLPPRKEIYDFYRNIVETVVSSSSVTSTPEQIYISRRTWKHNNLENIGTNYTTRRLLVNEDCLVDKLIASGYKEVFTETLTTKEKILLFYNAKQITGAIGGGMCNVLFAQNDTPITVIVSPTFLDINKRFEYSFFNKNVTFFTKTEHVEASPWKKYIRVKVPSEGIIGEIVETYDDTIDVSYSDKSVAGWNSEMGFTTKNFNKSECVLIDNGLNSAWKINLNRFK